MALEVGFFVAQRKGNYETLAALYVGGIEKCKDISRAIEADVVEGLIAYVVESYWFHRVCNLTSDDNVIR